MAHRYCGSTAVRTEGSGDFLIEDQAILHVDDPVALKPDFPGVGHHEERLSTGPIQFTQKSHELSGTYAVEVASRFIGPHNRGRRNDGASNCHPLLLSTR